MFATTTGFKQNPLTISKNIFKVSYEILLWYCPKCVHSTEYWTKTKSLQFANDNRKDLLLVAGPHFCLHLGSGIRLLMPDCKPNFLQANNKAELAWEGFRLCLHHWHERVKKHQASEEGSVWVAKVWNQKCWAEVSVTPAWIWAGLWIRVVMEKPQSLLETRLECSE